MNENRIGVAEHKHLLPLEKIKGYDVRPGFYGINGATALREGVSFTVCSMEATDVELLLYHRGERKPIKIDIEMSGDVGFFQIEEVLLQKIDASPAKQFVELYAGVEGQERKCYL